MDRYVPPRSEEGPASGTWLGHLLHPVLTDVVLGAWTSLFLLDLHPGAPDPQGLGPAGRHRHPGGGADRAGRPVRLGRMSGAALPGGAGPRRRQHRCVVPVRALVAGPQEGRRLRGWWLSATGFGVITASAYLGGHLSLGKGIGVDQTAFDEGPTDWQPVIADADLPEGSPTPLTVGAVPLLVRRGATIYADFQPV